MQVFNEIKNTQKFPVEFFEKSLEKNQIARAYLLTGDALEDKINFVKAFNKVVNCQLNLAYMEKASNSVKVEDSLFAGLGAESMGNASLQTKFLFQEPCGECQNCRWIEEGNHPKTPISLAADEEAKTKTIKVEAVRNLLNELVQSSESYRIVVIEDASSKSLNRHSATALLKTIEEAKPNTLFMIFADAKDSVLSTIVSRSQVVPFSTNAKEVFSETSLEHFQNLLAKLENADLSTRLSQLTESETLSALENDELVEILVLLQNNLTEALKTATDSNEFQKKSDQILELDKAINDIRGFIRPKAVMEALLPVLVSA